MADDKKIEQLRKHVAMAQTAQEAGSSSALLGEGHEKARAYGSFAGVQSVYDLWLGEGKITPVNMTVDQLAEKLSSSEDYDENYQLLAVGLLRLQTIQLKAAIFEFERSQLRNNDSLSKDQLTEYVEQYKAVFAALLFVGEAPHAIHEGSDLFVEYHQNLAAIKMLDEVLSNNTRIGLGQKISRIMLGLKLLF